MEAIRLANLKKSFAGKPALHGLSFAVERGEIFGLLGQVFPASGEAFIDGVSVQRDRGRALAKTGAIFEAPRFYDYLSGWRNLEIFTCYSAIVPRKEMQDAVEFVGLTARIHDKVGTYSQGMRQRLGLAQALLPANEVILLDEPTNGLDPEGIHEMRELIKRLNRERGITVVFCSHLLVEVEQLCDHVVILNQGRKIFDGRWADLAEDRRRVRLAVDNWERAAALLGALVVEPGIIAISDGVEIADLVAKLVNGGVRVSAVEPQRRNLEQVYLEMTHSSASSSS